MMCPMVVGQLPPVLDAFLLQCQDERFSTTYAAMRLGNRPRFDGEAPQMDLWRRKCGWTWEWDTLWRGKMYPNVYLNGNKMIDLFCLDVFWVQDVQEKSHFNMATGAWGIDALKKMVNEPSTVQSFRWPIAEFLKANVSNLTLLQCFLYFWEVFF